MSLDEIRPEMVRPGLDREITRANQGGIPTVKDVRSIVRDDRVDISDEARILSFERGAEVDEELDTERIEEVRRRIDEGFYDSPDVAGEIARRLADSGDW